MEFDNPVSEKLEHVELAVRHLLQAMRLHNAAIAELQAHSQAHHNVINGHARALETLEALMIGGPDETALP